MGHIRLGQLPRTRKWNEVVELLRSGETAPGVAAAALDAAEEGFRRAADDLGFTKALWLLTQLPLAARAPDYLGRLKAIGVDVEHEPGPMALVGAFTDALDAAMRAGGRTDIGEIAQMSAAETLARELRKSTASLFGTTAADVRRDLASWATTKQFGTLAREFFSAVTRRYLAFYLSRELSNHVGGNRRFANSSEHAQFDDALDLYCRQATRIVEEFAGGWFSKTNWEQGTITQEAVRTEFSFIALKKLRAELKRGGGTTS